jgi:hypothetical protein
VIVMDADYNDKNNGDGGNGARIELHHYNWEDDKVTRDDDDWRS